MAHNRISQMRLAHFLYDNCASVAIICLAAVAFLIDIMVDRPLSIGVMYVPIIFLRLLLQKSPPTNVLLSIVVILDIVGFLFPNISDDIIDSAIDHACVIFVACGASFVVENHYKLHHQLISSNNKLDKLFEETDSLRCMAEAGRNAKRDFISSISSELRDPTSSIINFSEMIAADNELTQNKSKYTEYVMHINQAATELLAAIDEILEFSDSHGRLSSENEYKFDLCDAIKSVVDNNASVAKELGIDIHIRYDRAPKFVIADPVMLTKAFSNILQNAIKVSSQDSVIDISISTSPSGWVVASIRDYGPGIPVELVPQIGQVFIEDKLMLGRNAKGLGIGLALTSRYMNYHQGSMEIAETSEKGTEIRLTLPPNRAV